MQVVLLEIKYTDSAAGIFSLSHAIYISVTFVSVLLLLYISRRISRAGFERLGIILATALTAAEAIKITVAIASREPIDNWIPLYFCGLFLPALWLLRSGREKLRRAAYAYVTMGGIPAGLLFTLYPSTSLARYPATSPLSIHAAIFHGAMIYFGLIILRRGFFLPRQEDGRLYFWFVTAAVIPSAIINHLFGTNCMFLSDPFGLPLVTELCRDFPTLYAIGAWLMQAFLLFKISLTIYKATERRKTHAQPNNQKHL